MTRKLRNTLAVSSIALACVAFHASLSTAAPDGALNNNDAKAKGNIAIEARGKEKLIKLAQSATPGGDSAEKRQIVIEDVSNPVPDAAAKAAAEIPAPKPEQKIVYDALQKHCARCHQDGLLEDRVKASARFGNVLDLDAIAKDPKYVIPGNPDGSSLITQILSGDMPYDLKDGSNPLAPTPTKEEISAIRNWIVSLKESASAACATRKFQSFEHTIDIIAADLERQPDHRVKGMRYLTLDNLYNGCADEKEMEVYRQGAVKLLNSLSQSSDVLHLKQAVIGEYGTVIAFNIHDLGWTEGDWETIIHKNPYSIKPDYRKYDYLVSQVHTQVPYVRADWFAFSASRPPLYEKLLKLPLTFQELEAKLHIDTLGNIRKYLAKRSGFEKSLVSQHNRLIERHQISTGYFWTSYDFAGTKGKQSLFEAPLGPKSATGHTYPGGDEYVFDHDGGESIFSLPNGFQAYYLNEANGKYLEKGPTEIVRDKDRVDFAVTNGISCFGCHDQGMRLAKDNIREHVVGDPNFPKEVREAVEALYTPQEEMHKILLEDTKRFQDAMRRAGLDPALKLGGFEPINVLSNRYENNITLRYAAAEFGMTIEQFETAAQRRGGSAGLMLKKLQQRYVPRDNMEGQFNTLLSQITDHAVIAFADSKKFKEKGVEAYVPPKVVPGVVTHAVVPPKVHVVKEVPKSPDYKPNLVIAKPNHGDAKVKGKFDLTLIASQKAYKVNDLPVFIVQSDRDCHLTLINVDDKGVGTVLLPNKFQKKAFLKAHQAFEFPGPHAPFQFRFKDHGTETVIAICNQHSKHVDAIVHNFNNKAFTDLGNYENFVTRAIVVEANHKVAKKVVQGQTLSGLIAHTGAARAAIKIPVH